MKAPTDSKLYEQCYLMILAGLLLGLLMWIMLTAKEWNEIDIVIGSGVAILSVYLIVTALRGRKKEIDNIADSTTRTVDSWPGLILAYPIYLIVKKIKKRNQNQSQ
jgi:uncharacterized membrane protein YkvI